MRPTNGKISEYVWYDSTFPNGVFTMHPCDDTKSCIFCHQPAPSSIYYPPLELMHFAPADIPKMRARVCNNHYNHYRKISKNATFPIPIDEMYGILMKKSGLKDMDTSVLPKWSKSFLTDTYEWRGASIPAAYYERFKDFIHEEALLFKGFELRYPAMRRFVIANSDIPEAHLITFEKYMLQPGCEDDQSYVSVAADKRLPKSSSTMFD